MEKRTGRHLAQGAEGFVEYMFSGSALPLLISLLNGAV